MIINDEYMENLIKEYTYMMLAKKSSRCYSKWFIRKYIAGYKRKYLICRNGLVFNRDRGTWLKPQVHSKNGYLYVDLYLDGKKKKVYLHRLIGEYYSPNPYNLDCVFHKDGDKTNNRVSNVWWTSRSLIQSDHDPENPPKFAKLPDHRKNKYLIDVNDIINLRGSQLLEYIETRLRERDIEATKDCADIKHLERMVVKIRDSLAQSPQ